MEVKLYQKLIHGTLLDFCTEDLSETFRAWNGEQLQLPNTGTHIGFVYSGSPLLYRNAGKQDYKLHPGMYFSLPGAGGIGSKNSSGFVITCPTYCGTFLIGGAIETTGNFNYINGGTDSLLIPPIKQGDPCLNALYFPPKTDQIAHTHPSYRLVIVTAGNGECETPESIIPLQPEVTLLIPSNQLHKFRTTANKLTVICFHPDSETGFTDNKHPMLKRTFVDGISASEIPQIQTSSNNHHEL